jgi:hypothetical protein
VRTCIPHPLSTASPHLIAMLGKGSLVAAITLSILVSAVPFEHQDTGIRIPLGKRASFVKSDGTFDLEKAIEHTVRVHNKHRQNLINLERNVGKEAFNPVSLDSPKSPYINFLIHDTMYPRVLKSDLLQYFLPSLPRSVRSSHSLTKMTLSGPARSPSGHHPSLS